MRCGRDRQDFARQSDRSMPENPMRRRPSNRRKASRCKPPSGRSIFETGGIPRSRQADPTASWFRPQSGQSAEAPLQATRIQCRLAARRIQLSFALELFGSRSKQPSAGDLEPGRIRRPPSRQARVDPGISPGSALQHRPAHSSRSAVEGPPVVAIGRPAPSGYIRQARPPPVGTRIAQRPRSQRALSSCPTRHFLNGPRGLSLVREVLL